MLQVVRLAFLRSSLNSVSGPVCFAPARATVWTAAVGLPRMTLRAVRPDLVSAVRWERIGVRPVSLRPFSTAGRRLIAAAGLVPTPYEGQLGLLSIFRRSRDAGEDGESQIDPRRVAAVTLRREPDPVPVGGRIQWPRQANRSGPPRQGQELPRYRKLRARPPGDELQIFHSGWPTTGPDAEPPIVRRHSGTLAQATTHAGESQTEGSRASRADMGVRLL